VKVQYGEDRTSHTGPKPCVVIPRGMQRSVGRGKRRPAIEPRKMKASGADTVLNVEGNTTGRVIVSTLLARRGRRTWHVQKLFVREPGGLAIDHRPKTVWSAMAKARSLSHR
jgi:hypothetical protein